MKTLHLSIITGLGISAMIVLAVILMSFNSQQIRIEGVNDTYKVGDIINATVFYGKQQPPCISPSIVLKNATNQSQTIWEIPGYSYNDTACRDNFWTEFYAGIKMASVINSTQSYVIYTSLGNQHAAKEFTVYTDPNRKYYTEIQVAGPNQTLVGVPIEFKITIRGHGIFDAGQSPDVSVINGNGTVVWHSTNGLVLCCPAEMSYYNFTLDTSTRWSPIILNESGSYSVKISYNDKTVEKKFTVLHSNSSSNLAYDDQVIVSYSNGTREYFPFNYTITEGNNLLDSKLDNESRSVILSIHSMQDGNLTLTLSPKLVDFMEKDKKDSQFIVLEDGQEVNYKEYIHDENMIMTIHFPEGTKEIEIIPTEIV